MPASNSFGGGRLTSPGSADDRVRLFVYGSFLPGERDHALLVGAECLGSARTESTCTLVDLGLYPALLLEGDTSVTGEVYLVTRAQRFQLDVKKECPALFQRSVVLLADGTRAETYVMREEQVRGKRRLKQGDWRGRFAPKAQERGRAAWIEALRRR